MNTRRSPRTLWRGLLSAAIATALALAGTGEAIAAPASTQLASTPTRAIISGTVSYLQPEAIHVEAYVAVPGQLTDPTWLAPAAMTTVNGQGTYSLEVPAGDYLLRFSGSFYADSWYGATAGRSWTVVSARPGTEAIADHAMSPTVWISGVITGLDDWENARVLAYTTDGQGVYSMSLRKNGNVTGFVFSHLGIGRYKFALYVPDRELIWYGTSKRNGFDSAAVIETTRASTGITLDDWQFRSDEPFIQFPQAWAWEGEPGTVGSVAHVDWRASSAPSTARWTNEWLRNGVVIPGAVSSQYRILPDDAGAAITFRVIMTSPTTLDTTAKTHAVTIAKLTPTVTAKASTLRAGVKGKISTKVSVTDHVATGKISVYRGSKRVGYATLSRGAATVTISGLPRGTHKLKVSFAGSSAVNAASVYLVVKAR